MPLCVGGWRASAFMNAPMLQVGGTLCSTVPKTHVLGTQRWGKAAWEHNRFILCTAELAAQNGH